MRLTSFVFALVSALAGCGSGCDGERRKPPDTPRTPHVPDDAGGAAVAVPQDGAPVAAVGFLDAPGPLDALFSGLAAAERAEPTAASCGCSSATRTPRVTR